MTMTINTNIEAIHTLSLFNRNSKEARKYLQQAATGMKITSAADNASAYAISERMRVRIRALDQATNIGAYLQRLEYTADNITTSTENVQASESTIRDADLARTMTNYTKSNVLTQAAQFMLAQANQNSSAVLSLL